MYLYAVKFCVSVYCMVGFFFLYRKYTNKSGTNNGPHTYYPSVRTTFPGKQTNLPLVGWMMKSSLSKLFTALRPRPLNIRAM
jgi:hypothetical protein